MDWIKNHLEEALLNYYDKKLNQFWYYIKMSTIDLSTLAYILFIIFIGYKMFFKNDEKDYKNIYMSTVIYTVIRLFWKVKFGM